MSGSLITDAFRQVKRSSARQQRQFQKPLDASRPKEKTRKEKSHEDLDQFEILIQFDLESAYGPCIGITRMERWERAEKFGLSPPEQVKKLLLEHSQDQKYTQCVWYDYNI